MGDAISMVSALLIVILILILAYYSTRWLGQHYNTTRAGRYMTVLDQITVGPDRYLMIVRIKGEEECFLIGSSPQEICVLARLEGEYEDVSFSPLISKNQFAELLKKYQNWGKKDKD